MMRRIVCAANRSKATGQIILGIRHWDSFMHTAKGTLAYFRPKDDWEQGFVDQKGNFLTREDAWVVAVKANQIIRDGEKSGGVLYSENLY